MTLKYFGTDGVRGVAFETPLTLQEVVRWGAAWAEVAQARGIREMVLGWDPRLSSEPLARAFAAGLGGRLELCVLGLVPTPAVAYASLLRPDAWGLMVSASHNPPQDNGIKGFDSLGEKLGEAEEQAVEEAYEALGPQEAREAALELDRELPEAYVRQLEPLDLPSGLRLVVDCAHGATAPWAPKVFRGGDVTWLGVPADGARINVGVGSTHLDALAAQVKARRADLGIAFDGDGDRCLLVDPQGEVVDGDQILWLLAQDLHATHGNLPGVVGTVMSNAGLEEALGTLAVPFERTPVGDKFMLRELARRNWDLAAEASGHVIQKHVGPSGDGLATALAVLRALLRRGPGDRWSWRFAPWPLELRNILARDRRALEECPRLQGAMEDLRARHGEGIRMVVRWSGTEPKLRLMVEAKSGQVVQDALASLENAARADLALG